MKKHNSPTSRYELNNSGARALICAVIEQAVTDFKSLVAAGRIVDGKVTPVERARTVDYRTDVEVQALLDFFTSEVMDEWIFLTGIRINPNLIRERLGIPGKCSRGHESTLTNDRWRGHSRLTPPPSSLLRPVKDSGYSPSFPPSGRSEAETNEVEGPGGKSSI